MDFRKMGILDPYFASPVVSSRLSTKAMSFPVVGNNINVGTVTEEDVWNAGGRLTYMTAPALLDLVSTSTEDNLAGTGLAEIIVTGLGADYNLQTELVTLNGTTIVPTTLMWIRIHSLIGSKPSPSDINTVAAGIVTLSEGANVQGQINLGDTASSMSMFTIPAGYTGFFDQVVLSGGPNDDFIVRFKFRLDNNIFITRGGGFEITNSNVISGTFDPKFGAISEKTDTKFVAIGVTANAQIRTNHTLTIVENDYLKSLAKSI